MRRRIASTFLALAVLACALPAQADDATPLDLAAIRAQQAEIRAGANAKTGLYEDMPETTRRQLVERQDQVLRVIEGKATSAELTEDERMDVFNDLEWIEAAINDAEDNRMVCERRKQVGSNRVERICMTVAQQREARERAREQMLRPDRNMRVGN